MKTYIGTLALLVTIGFTAEARADQELGLTLEPVTSEAQLHQAMVQNRARVAAMYRNIWEQAENAKQSQQQLKDGDQAMNQTRTRTRTQAKKQLEDGTQTQAKKQLEDGDQAMNQTRTRTRTQAKKQLEDGTQTQLRSALKAQRDGDGLASQLRYQTRERMRTNQSEAQGKQGAGGKRMGGHGRVR